MALHRSARHAFAVILTAAAISPIACTTTPPPTAQCGYVQSTDLFTFPPGDQPNLTVSGQCLGRAPDLHDDGTPNCIVLHATSAASCDCTGPGLMPVPEAHAGAIEASRDFDAKDEWSCFCEVTPLTGDAQIACQNDSSEPPTSNGAALQGYCYLDRELGLGDPEISSSCPGDDERFLRLAGEVTKPAGQSLVIFCAATLCDET